MTFFMIFNSENAKILGHEKTQGTFPRYFICLIKKIPNIFFCSAVCFLISYLKLILRQGKDSGEREKNCR